MEFNNIRLSYYKSVADKIGEVKSLSEIVNELKSVHKDIVEEIRAATSKEERNRLKKTLPAFTCSGTFSSRKADNLTKHSGLIQIDIDQVENINDIQNKINQDPYTYISFVSPSGNGLKILVKINLSSNSHLENFKALELHYMEQYFIAIDPSTKDICRLCFVSYDPDIFVNTQSSTFTCGIKEVNNTLLSYTSKHYKVNNLKKAFTSNGNSLYLNKIIKKSYTSVLPRFEKQLEEIEYKKIDITTVYDDWLKIGFAICSEFGEQGREYFHRISRINLHYSQENCNAQYSKCLQSNRSGITIATFFDFAKKALLKSKTKEKESKTIFHITEEELSRNYELRFNAMKLEIEIRKLGQSTWEACNESQLYVELFKNGIPISESKLNALLRTNYVKRYDPILDYFENLDSWKNGDVDYIAELMSYITVYNQQELVYTFRKWIVRCVKCALQPDYYNKQAFILVHDAQNSGKSTFCRNLCPEILKEFMRDDLPDNKDAKIALANNFFINLDEMANLNKKDVDHLKTCFSMPQIKERLPYDRKPTTLPRRANFIGSTNNKEFLADPTGSVRFICFEIQKINWAYKTNINIDQVWCQAYALYKDPSFECEFTEEDIAQNERRNENFQLISPEEELLLKYFQIELKEDERTNSNFYSTTEILNYLNDMTTRVNLSVIKLGKILSKLKVKKYQHTQGIGRGYYLKKKEV